uniref:Activin_recp domain-containing protein n=1 Tax=Syphacia muris TaxID=451379 RepID=A0A0N5AXW9_9BILA
MFPKLTDTLICISHHEYHEDGKIRLINLNHCGAYNGFCVKVKFWDKDPLKKRGYSRGCDKNDCLEFGNSEYGWNEQGCRRNQDYGSEGEICCCKTDMCNTSSTTNINLTIFVFFTKIAVLLEQMI